MTEPVPMLTPAALAEVIDMVLHRDGVATPDRVRLTNALVT